MENYEKEYEDLEQSEKDLVISQMEIQNKEFCHKWKSPKDFWNGDK